MEAQQNDYILFFGHDPSIECSQLTEKGIRMKDSFRLKRTVRKILYLGSCTDQ